MHDLDVACRFLMYSWHFCLISHVVDRMNHNTACRIAIRIRDNVQFIDSGKDEYHISKNINWVRDKDTFCWKDFLSDLNVQMFLIFSESFCKLTL